MDSSTLKKVLGQVRLLSEDPASFDNTVFQLPVLYCQLVWRLG